MRATCLLAMLLVCAGTALAQPEPTPVQDLAYDVDFFPGTVYDPTVPTPESLLGFRPGDRAAFPHEIELALQAWGASPRVTVVEYARSHEGRALYYAIITSPANHARIDSIRAGLARLADPRGLSDGEAEALITGLPGTAWLAYSIHGDETSGSDAALAVIYHLAAAQGDPVEGMLDELVVLIDPMMNPDGRNRFLQQVAEHRGAQPNVDDQSLLHGGYWPWGRTNHYGFDLNRDWILGVNPETKGRIREASLWHPLLFVDAHEMGSQDTYLFSPQRDPRNPHVPGNRDKWGRLFAREQSQAFDRYGWTYYTGEWNEGWYPGYSDVWGEFRGAVGILYEQAGFTEDGVRRPGGAIHSYREAVHHQAVSSLANLMTLQANVADIRRDILAERRLAVSANGPYARRTFAVLPTGNRSRLRGFVSLMELQGFEYYRTTSEFQASGTDQLGQSFQGRTIPVGTMLIPNRQPEGNQVATMLQFDTQMTPEYLERERKAILRTGSSTIYDVTAWNLTMMYGLEALTLDTGLPSGVEAYPGVDDADASAAAPADVVAWAVDGSDDASVSVAARLMERG
ncbi:MAG: M14 family zinc carboxypeptidase, partial [Gemmatimonadetes bacterium]|nr:M14 family zinc carboxypeptidase [Gemmatimonadota bacterium]